MSALSNIEILALVSGGGAGTNPELHAGSVDPSAGGGVAAPEGSTYQRFIGGAGELWLKTGALATDWTQLT